MKPLHAPRVKSKMGSPRRIKSTYAMEAKVTTRAKVSRGLKITRRSGRTKNHRLRRRSGTYPRSNVSIVTTTNIWQRITPSHLG